MENDDNDIELLAGQVWNAPVDVAGKYAPFTEQEVDRMAAYFGKMQDETFCNALQQGGAPYDRPDWAKRALVAAATFLKPQAQVVRHPIPPELSEQHPMAPDYRDMLGKKGGA